MENNRNFLGGLVSGEGVNAKVTVDVPDKVYINLFFTIFFAAAAAGASVAIVKRLINK